MFIYHFYLKFKVKKDIKVKNEKYINSNINNANYIVYVLYCTKDDFDQNSILKSMKQKYKNCKFFILDDSSDSEYIKKIDQFSKIYDVEVVRRVEKKGFKAGNLNNFLSKYKNFDYFVVLDSDSIIPPDFIGKSLLYFQEDEKIGIVQSKNICNRQQNLFDYIGSYIHNVEQQADFTTRNIFGMQLFSGHNAIISKECFDSIGGLPQILGEDHGFSYQAFSKKFKIILANNIFSYETYPIEYFFFKKRQHRWTIGGAEIVRYIWWPFLKSNENIFKKTDLIIAQTEMFLTTFTTIVSIFNITILLPLNFYV